MINEDDERISIKYFDCEHETPYCAFTDSTVMAPCYNNGTPLLQLQHICATAWCV